MDNDVWWGLGSLLLGIYSLWDVIKHPVPKPDIHGQNFKGYLVGVIGTAAGVFILLNALLHLIKPPSF